MADLRVGLVGFGLAGQAFHAPLVATTPGLALASVVTSHEELVLQRFPEAQVVPSIEVLLLDSTIDLVVIASPDELHCPHAIAALEAGKHVVVDKPFALDRTEARRMIEAAERAGCLLTVFHNRRCDADFLTLRALVDAGKLGKIMQFESHFDRFRAVPLDRWKDRRAGGVWQDLGPHLVDQTLQLFGLPVDVMADIAAQKSAAPDYAHVVLRYETLRVILHMSQAMPDHGLRFSVHGTGGSYIKSGLDPQEAQAVGGMLPGAPEWGIDADEGVLTRVIDAQAGAREPVPNLRGDYPAFYTQVRDAILGTGPNPVPPEQAMAVMRVIDAGLLSAREGRTIRLDSIV